MKNSILGHIFTYKFTPVILLLLCIVSYGLLTPLIGFFLDDWYLVWFKHVFGSLDFIDYFALDRPLMGYFYIAANFLLGNSESPLIWQIFGVFTRWLCALSFLQMLNTIWPSAKRVNTYAALLAAVFPGFVQQWIAVIYCFFFTCLAGFFFSITLMLKAVRTPKRFWLFYVLSILIMAYVVPASEFFVGLELIRLMILYFEFGKEYPRFYKRLGKAILYDIPFILILLGFVTWRALFFNSVNHAFAVSDKWAAGLGNLVVSTIQQVYQAIVDAVINAWANPFNLTNYPQKGIMSIAIPLLVIATFCLLLLWLWKTDKTDRLDVDGMQSWHKQAPWLAVISMVVAIIPFWSANLPIDYRFPYDRFLLAYLFGSCLLIVWLFDGIGKGLIKTALTVSLLTAVAMGYQLATANQYKNLWATQQDFYWQFVWRVPNLSKGTTVFTYQMPDTEYWSGNSLTSFLNWTYADQVVDRKIDYQFILQNSGQENVVSSLTPDQTILSDFRTYTFEGNTSKSIYIFYSTDSCMRVLDNGMNSPEFVVDYIAGQTNPQDVRLVNTLAGSSLTDLGLIYADAENPSHPPTNVIGAEPGRGWCYFFEKADFANQSGDYAKVVDLYNEALAGGYSALDETEYYPIIDALARTEQWDQAKTLTLGLLPTERKALNNGLCYIWTALGENYSDSLIPANVLAQLDCQP